MVEAELDDFGDIWSVAMGLYGTSVTHDQIRDAFYHLMHYDRADICRSLKYHIHTKRHPPCSKTLMALS